MIVAKFGGTSVGNSKRIKNLVGIIQSKLEEKPVVVVSAVSGVTDRLLSLVSASISERKKIIPELQSIHEEIASELGLEKNTFGYIRSRISRVQKLIKKSSLKKEDIDELVSNGEIISSYIVARTFLKNGIQSKQIIATDLIITNDNFGAAEFLPDKTQKKVKKTILPLIKKGIIPIVTGFIGATQTGKTTTLGRGGSDYTASIIGYSLHAREVQIWTDVDGILTTDPRIVKNAKILPEISYREASELATFGARVLHPRTIKPAIEAKIPVRILNSFNPNNPGTLIVEKVKNKKEMTAIAFKRKVTLVNIYSTQMLLQKGFLARIFEVFTQNNISIDLVSVSEVSVSVTLDDTNNLNSAVKALSTFASISVENNLGIVSLIGDKIVGTSSMIKNIFSVLDKKKVLVRMVSLGAIDINMSLVIQSGEVERAVRVLHNNILLKQY